MEADKKKFFTDATKLIFVRLMHRKQKTGSPQSQGTE